jgi:choline dehydrogenase
LIGDGSRRTIVRGLTYVVDLHLQALLSEVEPGLLDQGQLREWVKANRYPNSHWCGSARMGNPGEEGDAGLVVDQRLRVRGVKGLRVADASVIPSIPSGNVHSSVLVVASIGADMLIEEGA